MDRHRDEHDPTLMGNDRPRHDRDQTDEGAKGADQALDRPVSVEPGLTAPPDPISPIPLGVPLAPPVADRRADGGITEPAPSERSVEDHIGEAAGGISGVLTGAAIGSLGGPIGTVIGAVAGAIGGWWAGHAIAEAATHYTDEDDAYYRSRYEDAPNRLADRAYDDVRPAYQLGHVAGRNPDYTGRSFDDIEPEIQQGWTSEVRSRHGEWAAVRDYARDAYTRKAAGGPSLSEAADSRAVGDGTAVTGYATGLEETVQRMDDEPPRSGSDRVKE